MRVHPLVTEETNPAPAATAAPTDNAAPAAPVEAAKPAEADFDTALAEFESSTAKPADPVAPAADVPTEQPTALDTDAEFTKALQNLGDNVVDERVQQEMQKREFLRQEHEAGMAIIAADGKELRAEFGDQISDQEIDWYFSARLSMDQRISRAFFNRGRDQRTWRIVHKKMLGDLRREIASRPDRNATEDREAVAAAVRGASAHAPPEPAPKLGNLNAADFAKYTRDNFGF
jgi:hypothetical protein